MKLKVKRLHPDAKLPTQATPGSACYDVYTLGKVTVWNGKVTRISCGLAFEVPEGYFIEIRPRSGLASKGLTIVNSPGTLDSDYRGELMILMFNVSPDPHSLGYGIKKGDRIAQIRLVPVLDIEFEAVCELDITERGAGGFGSTGK